MLKRSFKRLRLPVAIALGIVLAWQVLPSDAAVNPDLAAAPSDLVVNAAADAYVSEVAPTTAEGSVDAKNCFLNDDAGNARRCLVTFKVTGLGPTDTVTGADFRIVDKGNAGTKLVNLSRITPTDWSEGTVTWNTRPSPQNQVSSQISHAYGVDTVFKLNPGTVTGNGTYSFVMWSPAGSYDIAMNFQPKENTDGKLPPRLVIHKTQAAGARFPGDPGAGMMRIGLNDTSYYGAVESHMPHPFTLRRIYNNNNWGVQMTATRNAINAGKIPMVSWKYSPYAPGTVPQSAFDSACSNLKSFAPHAIWVVLYHEPEDDITTAVSQATYRADQRHLIQTCRAAGVTNVAYGSPYYMDDWTFSASSGRHWWAWNAEWKGTISGINGHPTSADFAQSYYDFDGFDPYIPGIGANVGVRKNWHTLAELLGNATNAMTADGYTVHPIVLGEMGVKSDTVTPDLTIGPTYLQGTFDFGILHNVVGIAYWNIGGDSFCHGENPPVDPQCLREITLARISGDSRVVFTAN